MKIYLAAPIHQKADAEANARLLEALRANGFDVWSPQEAGIASEIAKSTGEPLDKVREEFMHKDLAAMKRCDVCLAFLGRQREPSQGMLWEMGYMTAANKVVIIYNPHHNKYTLMAQFTCDFLVTTFDKLYEVLNDIR